MASTGRVPAASSRELRQESQIVFEEQPDVVDAMLEHRDALDAQTEREPGEALRVVAHLLEHGGVDHPRATHLDVAGALAAAAARAAAVDAGHVVLIARLDEGEGRGPEPDRDALPADPAAAGPQR